MSDLQNALDLIGDSLLAIESFSGFPVRVRVRVRLKNGGTRYYGARGATRDAALTSALHTALREHPEIGK